MKKDELRIKYKNIRKNIKDKEIFDNIIFNKIINLKQYKNSKIILTYVSIQDEVDTIKLIKYSISIGKLVAVPKCKNNNIEFYFIEKVQDLERGDFNILEPVTNNKVEDFNKSICVIPGISFSKDNDRIGYGKGFYDRFLETYNGTKIGLCYKPCLCEKFNIDKYDIKMDIVITN